MSLPLIVTTHVTHLDLPLGCLSANMDLIGSKNEDGLSCTLHAHVQRADFFSAEADDEEDRLVLPDAGAAC